MLSPRFSVVVCTYQRAHLLPRAIHSVMTQTLGDFELIIIDDGSSEDAGPIVKAFEDPRIRFFRNAANRGLAYSSNLAFGQARGEFITFLDDDDEYHPNFLEETDRHLRTHDLAFCWCGVQEHFCDGQPTRTRVVQRSSENRRSGQMVAVLIGSGFGLTFHRDCLASVPGYDENLQACADADFLLSLVQGPWKWAGLPKVLVSVHRQPERMTLANLRYAESLRHIIIKHQRFLEAHQEIRSILYFQLGTILADAGERDQARLTMGRYLREVPGDLRAWSIFLSNELRYSWLGLRLLGVYRWFYHRYFA